MAYKKVGTERKGIRYREHPTRKYQGKPDRYYFIRYKINGKNKEEALGWASDGWNVQKALVERAKLRNAQLTGTGAQTLGEKRELEAERRAQEQAVKEQNNRESIPFSAYFSKTYFPEAMANKDPESYRREKSLFENWIEPVIGKMSFKNIRPFNLERIKKNMADAGRAPRTAQYALAVVRQVFNHAIINCLIIV